MECVQSRETIVLYTYRYIYKTKAGELVVRFLTEPQDNHARYQQSLLDDDNIVSCIREYVNEINFAYLGFTEPVKEEAKEEKENEKA